MSTLAQALARISHDWGIRAFGAEHINNPSVRALRHAEESIELAQTLDVPEEKMHLLVTEIYRRAKGNPRQEVGGVMVTLHVLCITLGIDPDEEFLIEVRRVLAKSPEHFAERNRAKIDAGLDVRSGRVQGPAVIRKPQDGDWMG